MDTTLAGQEADAAEQALAAPTYRRDLGDGLLLRWSTAADTERLATFYGLVFRQKQQDPPNTRVMAWTRDLLSGRHPLIGEDGFALVENTATGEIVAATCLLSESWEYDGIPFRVGRPEIVGSLPDYRRRGLVREVMRLIHARSQTQGDLAQVITGIWWYYRQFGYEYTVELENITRIVGADIPAAKEGEPEPFTLRPATEADIPDVARLYDEERAGALVSTPIDARYWHWAIVACDPEGDSFARVFMVEDARGAVVGYTLVDMRMWSGEFSIYALWLRRGAWLDALPAVLRAVRRIGEETTPAHGAAEPLRALKVNLPPTHPALAALPARHERPAARRSLCLVCAHRRSACAAAHARPRAGAAPRRLAVRRLYGRADARLLSWRAAHGLARGQAERGRRLAAANLGRGERWLSTRRLLAVALWLPRPARATPCVPRCLGGGRGEGAAAHALSPARLMGAAARLSALAVETTPEGGWRRHEARLRGSGSVRLRGGEGRIMSDPTAEMVIERRVAGVLLVDTRGWLLLQLRSLNAAISPGQWSMPGGGIEPGEQPEQAARRELLEETGLRVAGPLTLFWEGLRPSISGSGALVEWHVYCARTTARQDDVVLGEGDAMEFTPPDRIASLNLGVFARFFLHRFLASAEYQRLCEDEK